MLTDTAVRQARPKEKEYKLSDERGLLLVVRPDGCKWWRLRYRFQGPEEMISLGIYPDVWAGVRGAPDPLDFCHRQVIVPVPASAMFNIACTASRPGNAFSPDSSRAIWLMVVSDRSQLGDRAFQRGEFPLREQRDCA